MKGARAMVLIVLKPTWSKEPMVLQVLVASHRYLLVVGCQIYGRLLGP